MNNILCLAAEGVIRDAETNGISVFNIFEGIAAQGFPFLIQKIVFFALWERDADSPEVYNSNITVFLNEQQLHSSQLDVNFQNRLRNRTIFTFGNLVIPQPGLLSFVMEMGGVESSYRIRIEAPVAQVQDNLDGNG